VLLAPENVVDPALDFATALRARSWAWLFEIGSSLSVEVRIVDLASTPVLPRAERASPILHHPEFVAAIGRAQRHQSFQTVQIDDTLVATVVLRVGGVDAAVLVVSRRIAAKPPPPAEQWRLEQIASFLRTAVEAHLESEIARSADEAKRLTALRRALDETDGGSERDLMRVFADAVSIWEDVDFHAYTQGVDGAYVLQWAPPGAAVDAISETLSVPPSLQRRELTHVFSDTLAQLGIAPEKPVAVAEIALNGSRWMFTFSRAADPACLNRLSLYLDILEESLKRLAISVTLRLCRAVWDRLLAADEYPARSAEAGLAEVVRALGADFGSLVVALPDGGRAIAAGEIERFADVPTNAATRQLEASSAMATGGTLTVTVGRREGRPPFAIGERDLLKTVADMLEPWAAAIVRRPTHTRKRPTLTQPFQQVVEELAQRTVRSGASVSVVVIRLGDGGLRPGAAHRLAEQIRSHLRAAEPAGALTDAEIAAVLVDTNPDQARAVIRRLRTLGATLDDGEALASAAMGVGHCAAGAAFPTSLILAARQDALRSGGSTSARGRTQ
jgi:hypothetical protein